jgi:hypothetical protein
MPPNLPAFGISGEFPGFWGALGYQAANEPIANMVNVIVVVDGSGKLIESGISGTRCSNSGVGRTVSTSARIDPERHVWVVDDFRHAIFKFRTTANGSCRRSACWENGATTTTSRAFIDRRQSTGSVTGLRCE